MILITAIQAVCFPLIKAGLAFAPPLLFGGLRALIGGAALLALVAVRRGPLLPPRSTWPGLLFLAVVATALTFAAMFSSPGRTEAGIASALGNLQPFFTLLLAYWFLSEALTSGKAAAAALGVAGVALISYPAFASSGAFGLSGALLALAVSAGSAVGNLVVNRMNAGRFLLGVTGWQLVIGGLPLVLLSLLLERPSALKPNIEFLGILLFLSLAGTAFVFALWYGFVQEGDVGRLATFFFLVPVFGLAIAVLVFGEAIGRLTVIGAIVILVAVGVMAFERPQPPPGSAERSGRHPSGEPRHTGEANDARARLRRRASAPDVTPP